MKNLSACTLLLLIAVTFFMCGKKSEQAQNQETITQYTCSMHPEIIRDKPGTCPICGMDLVKMVATGPAERSIRLGEDQIKLANITTAPARFESLDEITMLNGKLTVNEDRTELVSSRVPGRIERLYYKEAGQRVAKGQPLYSIYSESLLTLQQEYLLALRQTEELKEKHFESFLKASERKLTLFGMTKEQVAQLALRKKTDSQIAFLAPVSGVIAKINATEGQYVSEGSALYSIENLGQLWAEAELYSGESSLVKTGDLVKVKINGFENRTIIGKVTFLSPEYKQGTQIITLRAEIDNAKGEFLPGTQITVMLSHSGKKVIGLPIDAVIRDARGSHVWIRENDGSFSPRLVATGMENSEKVEITGGVEENENIVVSGAYLLYGELVLKKGEEPLAGHGHKDRTE